MKSIIKKALILTLSTASLCMAAVNESTNATIANNPAANTPDQYKNRYGRSSEQTTGTQSEESEKQDRKRRKKEWRQQEQNPQQGQWKNQPQVRAAVTMTPNGPQQTSPYAHL